MKKHLFSKRSRFDAPLKEVFKWHARPGALERLSPPWDPIQVLHRTGGIQVGAQVKLKMKLGPVPYHWHAEHTEYHENQMFRDRQVKGPFKEWVHTHQFGPDGNGGCFLEDHITYQLPVGPFSHFLADDMIQKRLSSVFTYRHQTLAADLHDHLTLGNPTAPLTFLISGASGVIGSVLSPYLMTGGHRVRTLSRRQPADGNQLFWDPVNAILDEQAIDGVDVVVHLAGENIGEGRWTDQKKKRIIDSRIKGTALIAKKIAQLNPLPKVFVCASAIGYYGNRGDQELTEEDACGFDFISGVCDEWEKAAAPAAEKGIRVVFLRIGVVLSPLGGALKKLLLPFKWGLGAHLGSGDQYLSWIGIDDAVRAIYHSVFNESLSGPVNVVAPHPVTNLEFTRVLGEILSRPTAFQVPEKAIELLYGEMGREVPLSSTRVKAEKLLQSGFKFRHAYLEEVLRHLLGKNH